MSALGDLILENLRKNNYYCSYESNNTEISSRCPYCGGSSRKTKRQFYIKVDSPPYLFHCFRCGVSGTISKLVIDFPELFIDVIRKFGSEILRYDVDNIEDVNSKNNVVNESGKICESCYEYLNERISSELLEQIEHLVVCCKDLKEIDSNLENFIGFKTIDSSQIICRNKDKGSDFRYKNIKTSDDRYFSYFYCSYTHEICNDDYICVIGEGIFTVLGGIDKLIQKHDKKINVIGIASLSKSRLYYLSKYVVPTLPFRFKKIIILLDKDSDIEKQIRKFSSLTDGRKYELVIPSDGKDLGENVTSYFIKKSKKEVLECLNKTSHMNCV